MWSMGLLNETDWKAKWIGCPVPTEMEEEKYRLVVEGLADDTLKLEKQLAAKVLKILIGRADAETFIGKLPVWTDSVPVHTENPIREISHLKKAYQ